MSRRAPKQLVVIAATPRSGSSLLFSALHASGISGEPTEFFNPANFAWYLSGRSRITRRIKSPEMATSRASSRSVRKALFNVADTHTTLEGTLSLKIMWSDLTAVLHDHGVDLDAFEVPIIWIRIRRNDPVRQAVSWAKAAQTQSWTSTKPEERVPTYNREQIAHLYNRIEPENAAWDAYLDAKGASPIEVTYEELDTNYEATVRYVLDRIGAVDVEIPPRQLSRQADDINDEWVERFRADVGITAPPIGPSCQQDGSS